MSCLGSNPEGTIVWILTVALLADTADRHSFKVPVAATESLHVETSGSGPPGVHIPVLYGSESGLPKLVPLLNGAGYRTIVIEPLGIGSSARPQRADYSLTAQADRIAGVLDSLGIRQTFVIAHSLGGAEAFRLAYRRPDLVRGLISLEGGPTEAAITPAFKRALRFAPWIQLFGGIELGRKKIRTMLLASSGDSTWVTDDVVIGYTAGAARSLDATLKAYLAMANSRAPEKLCPHLAEIRCPVRLVLGGARHEGDVGADEVRLLQRTVRAFALDSVAGAGHFLSGEPPEAVVAALGPLQATPPARLGRGRP